MCIIPDPCIVLSVLVISSTSARLSGHEDEDLEELEAVLHSQRKVSLNTKNFQFVALQSTVCM